MGWLAAHRPDIVAWCPQLPPSPAAAMDLLQAGLAAWQADRAAGQSAPFTDRLVVVGSSLGGFYATAVAELTGCRAVVLNPAVQPARDLTRYIGEQRQWHGEERFFFEPHFIDELKVLTRSRSSHPERLMAVIAKGDEVLDWREMAARYEGSTLRVLDGGDHALGDFDQHLADVLGFLGITPS